MKYSVTAAEAAKMLRKVSEEKSNLLDDEKQRCVFNAALGEDVESVRPEYDYEETRKQVDRCDRDMRLIKHAINLFNTTQTVGPEGMTIDQVLVYIPQLTEKKQRLSGMQSRLPKQRSSVGGVGNNTFVDYRYANYSIEKAREDYSAVSDELRALQTALDTVNNSVKLEFELPD